MYTLLRNSCFATDGHKWRDILRLFHFIAEVTICFSPVFISPSDVVVTIMLIDLCPLSQSSVTTENEMEAKVIAGTLEVDFCHLWDKFYIREGGAFPEGTEPESPCIPVRSANGEETLPAELALPPVPTTEAGDAGSLSSPPPPPPPPPTSFSVSAVTQGMGDL